MTREQVGRLARNVALTATVLIVGVVYIGKRAEKATAQSSSKAAVAPGASVATAADAMACPSRYDVKEAQAAQDRRDSKEVARFVFSLKCFHTLATGATVMAVDSGLVQLRMRVADDSVRELWVLGERGLLK